MKWLWTGRNILPEEGDKTKTISGTSMTRTRLEESIQILKVTITPTLSAALLLKSIPKASSYVLNSIR
jgi:hypothetical protein